MNYVRWNTTDDIPLSLVITDTVGNPISLTGSAPMVSIVRRSDQYYWNGSTFASLQTSLSMSEHFSGVYQYVFSQSSVGNAETYEVYYSYLLGPYAVDFEIHTVSAAGGGGITSNDLAAISASVWNALTSSHEGINTFGARVGVHIPTTSSLANLSEISSSILADGVKFSGSYIDIFVSSRTTGSIPTLAQISSSILADGVRFSGSFVDIAVSTRSSGAVGLLPSDIAAISASILADGNKISGSYIDTFISSRSSGSLKVYESEPA